MNELSLWYEYLSNESTIEQGDIFTDCLILVPGEEIYLSISKNIETTEGVDAKYINGIILSQSCDIENDKIDSLIICPIEPLSDLIKRDDFYKSKKGKIDLIQGKQPPYHLLDKIQLTNDQEAIFYIVNFRNIYTIPKSYINLKTTESPNRIRLNSPYKEHLSQSFARYFMRVGLPINISEKDLL